MAGEREKIDGAPLSSAVGGGAGERATEAEEREGEACFEWQKIKTKDFL